MSWSLIYSFIYNEIESGKAKDLRFVNIRIKKGVGMI